MDIRARDDAYRVGQDADLRRLIDLIRAGAPVEQLSQITFLWGPAGTTCRSIAGQRMRLENKTAMVNGAIVAIAPLALILAAALLLPDSQTTTVTARTPGWESVRAALIVGAIVGLMLRVSALVVPERSGR